MVKSDKTIKIIAIVNDNTVLINAGKRDGLSSGDSLNVLDNHTTKLSDPDTGEVLAEFKQFKQKIYVKEAKDKYSICVGKYTRTATNLSTTSNALAARILDTSGIIASSARYETQTETVGKKLNVNPEQVTDIFSDYSYKMISIGDTATLIK